MAKRYIACFDSGVGGLTTLTALERELPRENFIYYADTAHTPYGGRSRDEVLALTRACVRELLPMDLKALVLACNAATSAAAAELRAELDIPVLGLEPAVKPALAGCEGMVVALGTELTVRGEKFHNLLAALPAAERVIPLACPGLVELIEDDPRQEALADYLWAKLAPYQGEMQAVVLGCTHYVFLRPLLKKIWPRLALYDGNTGLSRHLAKILGEQAAKKGEERLVGPLLQKEGEEQLVKMQTAKEGEKQLVGPLWKTSERGAVAEQAFAAKCRRFYDFCHEEGI